MPGKRLTVEHKRNLAKTKMGSKNPMWKGDEATEGTIRWRLQRDMPVHKGSDRHHIDGNGKNSDPSNILVMTRREHMIKDGRMEALIKRNKMGRGRKLSPETREKMRAAQTPEIREKISAFAKSRKRDENGRFLKMGGG